MGGWGKKSEGEIRTIDAKLSAPATAAAPSAAGPSASSEGRRRNSNVAGARKTSVSGAVRGWSALPAVLSFRRDSLTQRRRASQSGRGAGSSSRRGSLQAGAGGSSSNGVVPVSELIGRLQEVIGPLHKEVAQMHAAQAEGLGAQRELWNEIKNISRRLNQLDGKWM